MLTFIVGAPAKFSAFVLILLLAAIGTPSLARGWHAHRGEHNGAEVHESGGRGRNSAYGKAKVEERDRLLSKLKGMNICRGC